MCLRRLKAGGLRDRDPVDCAPAMLADAVAGAKLQGPARSRGSRSRRSEYSSHIPVRTSCVVERLGVPASAIAFL